MSLEFSEEADLRKEFDYSLKNSGVSSWLVRIGIAKDEKMAHFIMIAIIIICFILAGFFYARTIFAGTNQLEFTEEEIQRLPPEIRDKYL